MNRDLLSQIEARLEKYTHHPLTDSIPALAGETDVDWFRRIARIFILPLCDELIEILERHGYQGEIEARPHSAHMPFYIWLEMECDLPGVHRVHMTFEPTENNGSIRFCHTRTDHILHGMSEAGLFCKHMLPENVPAQMLQLMQIMFPHLHS